MSIIRYSPQWDPFADIDDAFSRLPALNQSMKAFTPAMDVYETDSTVVAQIALAGVNPEDVKVSVGKGVLTVQGESKKEHEVDDKNYYRKEVRSGAFFRQVALPTAVVEDKVEASFSDGVLKITCPKAKASASKKIEIKIKRK